VTRRVRVFRRSTERRITQLFGHEPPTTDAVRLLRAGRENTDEWLDARTRTVGASEVSILMLAQHPYHSPFSLWHVKRHGWGRHDPTPVQERGHWMEEGIAGKFATERDDLVVGRPNGGLWADPQFPWLSCTPDFLTYGPDGLVIPLECKADEGGDGWGWGDEEVPAHHWWQVQQQCGVFGAPYGYLARWSSRGFRAYTVAFDEARYVAAAAEARRFMEDVASGLEPEPDGHDATGEVLRDLYPDTDPDAKPVLVPADWGAELEALQQSEQEIKRQIKDLKHKIRAMMGSSSSAYDTDGRVHVRSLTQRKQYTVSASMVDTLRTTSPKETP
jgi:predicted phage-related endonuclease